MNQQAYVKTVAKNLACSKVRRDEFVHDIESDINAALSSGESWANVEQRMGDPRQVAREFNENLSEAELAAGKKRRRNKIIAIVIGIALVVIVALALTAWWFLPQQHTAGQNIGLNEQAVVAQAQEVVEILNADDFAALEAISIDAMSDPGSEQAIKDAQDLISTDWGEFKSFSNAYSAEIVQAGQVGEVVEIGAIYENVSVTFTIFFNEDMQVTGLYMK